MGKHLNDNSVITYLATNKYDPTKNTGKMSVTVASGVGNGRMIIGDFNNDEKLTVSDLLMLLDNLLSGKALDTASHYHGVNDITIKNVISILKKIII